MGTHTVGTWTFDRDLNPDGTDGFIVYTLDYPNPLRPREAMPMAIATVFRRRDAPIIAAAPRMLAELTKIRDGYRCLVDGEQTRNDTCGLERYSELPGKCDACERRAELTKLIDSATGA